MFHDRDIEFFVAVGTVGVQQEALFEFGDALPLEAVALGDGHHAVLHPGGPVGTCVEQFDDVFLKEGTLR